MISVTNSFLFIFYHTVAWLKPEEMQISGSCHTIKVHSFYLDSAEILRGTGAGSGWTAPIKGKNPTNFNKNLKIEYKVT